ENKGFLRHAMNACAVERRVNDSARAASARSEVPAAVLQPDLGSSDSGRAAPIESGRAAPVESGLAATVGARQASWATFPASSLTRAVPPPCSSTADSAISRVGPQSLKALSPTR